MRHRCKSLGVLVMCALVLAGMSAATASASTARVTSETITCPEVFYHGGYPTARPGSATDQVRQPNNVQGLTYAKSVGAAGVESDLQLTRNGHIAVMWHNQTSGLLTGSTADVSDLWWSSGDNKLSGRRVARGPFKDSKLLTFEQYLDQAASRGLTPLVEIKSFSTKVLLASDATIRDRGWKQIIDPIKQRIDSQEIMVSTQVESLKAPMRERFAAAGIAQVYEAGPDRPRWPDTVGWNEPPPSYTGNIPSWTTALDEGHRRLATSWAADMVTWLEGRCS